MRLLSLQPDGRVSITPDSHDDIGPYAILSHTWGSDEDEVTFQDVSLSTGTEKPGYRKIEFCGTQATADDLKYFWVDTCCINKMSSAELQEAITSMFRWYQNSTRCYVYLPDVCDSTQSSWQLAFQKSRWFTRGWTLQELLAPESVEFFDKDWKRLGDKRSLIQSLHSITNISMPALQGQPLRTFSVNERMSWARGRNTKRKEDKAYSLIGIFNISMFLNYGEGEEHAMGRLRQEIGSSDSKVITSHSTIPLGRNKKFIPRENILDWLMDMIHPGADLDDCQRIAIEGLGGVGKTQIALEAAFRIRDKDPDCSVFWVPAVNRTTFESGYRAIGEALQIPGLESDKADIKKMVCTALSKSGKKWLIIYDNMDDLDLLLGGGDGNDDDDDDYAIRDYLPFNTRGSILFTTRNHEAVLSLDISVDHSISIKGMSEKEALNLLKTGVGPKQMQGLDSAKTLLELLAYLPLAIKQAAAYMSRTRMSTTKYLQRYRQSDTSHINLLSRDFEDRWRYRDIANPIATTWLVSFSHMEKQYPSAGRCLKLASFLAERDIPRELMIKLAGDADPDETIGILLGYSFIMEREGGLSFDMHRLVRLATRSWTGNETDTYVTAVSKKLLPLYPWPQHGNRSKWMKYLPHVQEISSSSGSKFETMAGTQMLDKLGTSHFLLGQFSAAERRYRQGLHRREKKLGRKHAWTLDAMRRVATTLMCMDKYDQAEEMHREALQISQETLGPRDRRTTESMEDLACVLSRRGKYKQAGEMHQTTLEIRQEIYGGRHPATIRSKKNIGDVFVNIGKYKEAETLFQEVLRFMKSKWGPRSPMTVVSMHALATAFSKQGKYEEAEQLHRQVLEVRKAELGPGHPYTLVSMRSLAGVLESMGKGEEAAEVRRQALQG